MRLLLFFFLTAHIAHSQHLVLQGVTVVPINSNTILPGCDVFIKGGFIEKIQPASSFPYDKKYKVMDCKGKYLMPGLADMHAHFPDEKSPIQLQEYLKLNLAAGVTSIRSMRGESYQLSLRDSISSLKKIAPSIYVSYVFPSSDSLLTKDSIEKIVLHAKNKKYNFIKYLGGINEKNLSYLVESCQKNNMTIAGHAYNRSLMKSVESGFTSVEHYQPVLSVYLKDSLNLNKNIEVLKEKHTAICPTLSFYYVYSFGFTKDELLARYGMNYISKKVSDTWMNEYTEVLFKTQEQLRGDFDLKYKAVYKKQFSDFNRVFKKMTDAGVLILLSPDDGMFNVPGFAMVEEMKLYKLAGLSNYQILKAATLNAAIYFHEEKVSGSVEVGKKANLLLLNANPLEDVENVSKVEGTILNGTYYSQKSLLPKVN